MAVTTHWIPHDEYVKFDMAVGDVLFQTGNSLAYPVYRRHKELVPDAMKGDELLYPKSP